MYIQVRYHFKLSRPPVNVQIYFRFIAFKKWLLQWRLTCSVSPVFWSVSYTVYRHTVVCMGSASPHMHIFFSLKTMCVYFLLEQV